MLFSPMRYARFFLVSELLSFLLAARLFQQITLLLLSFVSYLTVIWKKNRHLLARWHFFWVSELVGSGPPPLCPEPRITFQPSTKLSVPALGHTLLPGFIPLLEILVGFLDLVGYPV